MLGALTIAGTYIGTVIGAGFASGQEVMRFFSLFGAVGTYGIILATLLFAFFGREILLLGQRLGAASHRPVVAALGGRRLGRALDVVITLFLFGSLTTMVAAAGATGFEAWGLPHLAGSLAMAAAATGTVLFGLRGVVAAISRTSPILILSVVAISVLTLSGESGTAGAVREMPAVPWWPLSAVLYVSFNLVGALAVLAPLGASAARPAALASGALLGAAGLGLTALSIHLVLLRHLGEVQATEVPMLHVAGRLGAWAGQPYTWIIFLEVYTTAVASLFGLAARLGPHLAGGFALVTLVAGAASLLASLAGFVPLVANLYPVVGAAGLSLLAALARHAFNRSSRPQR